jgi:histidine triad (HIT) family protein
MPSIFTKIINGEIPCYKIAEDDNFIAFLDIMPLAIGHTLVVPKVEVDKLFDNTTEVLGELLVFAQPIAKAIEQAMPCNRVGISAIGLEVPHTHLHLVPINSANDINFTREKLKPTPQQMLEVQGQLIAALATI